MTLEIDFINKKNATLDPYDTDKMSLDLIQQFSGQAFTVGQQVSLIKFYSEFDLTIYHRFFH